MAMTAVFTRGIIPYHTHQELRPGVEQLRYYSTEVLGSVRWSRRSRGQTFMGHNRSTVISCREEMTTNVHYICTLVEL